MAAAALPQPAAAAGRLHSSACGRCGPAPSWTNPLAVVRYVWHPVGMGLRDGAPAGLPTRTHRIPVPFPGRGGRRAMRGLRRLRDGGWLEMSAIADLLLRVGREGGERHIRLFKGGTAAPGAAVAAALATEAPPCHLDEEVVARVSLNYSGDGGGTLPLHWLYSVCGPNADNGLIHQEVVDYDLPQGPGLPGKGRGLSEAELVAHWRRRGKWGLADPLRRGAALPCGLFGGGAPWKVPNRCHIDDGTDKRCYVWCDGAMSQAHSSVPIDLMLNPLPLDCSAARKCRTPGRPCSKVKKCRYP
eukprot:gene25976-6711_t